MIYAFVSTLFALTAGTSDAIAAETIPAGEPITASVIEFAEAVTEESEHAILSREAKRTIYAGQQVTFDNTRPIRLVQRNQIVTVRFESGAIEISMPARAMGAAARGEAVEVMNLDTRKMMQGVVQEAGLVVIQ